VISYATLSGFLLIATLLAVFVTIDWRAGALLLTVSIILQICALFIIYGSWAKGIHFIKISRFVFCIPAIINHVLFNNFGDGLAFIALTEN